MRSLFVGYLQEGQKVKIDLFSLLSMGSLQKIKKSPVRGEAADNISCAEEPDFDVLLLGVPHGIGGAARLARAVGEQHVRTIHHVAVACQKTPRPIVRGEDDALVAPFQKGAVRPFFALGKPPLLPRVGHAGDESDAVALLQIRKTGERCEVEPPRHAAQKAVAPAADELFQRIVERIFVERIGQIAVPRERTRHSHISILPSIPPFKGGKDKV